MDTDLDAIRGVVAQVQDAQQRERVEDFVVLFRHDAIWTTGHGRRLTGREEIAAFTRQVLPGAMRGTTVTYELLDVLFIRPDVAAARVRQTTTGPDGTAEGSPVYVMAKEDGRWLLTACQNTLVVPGAPHNPGKSSGIRAGSS
ncbi:SgcJ/EcaC family oxidoreductase [Dactylosporangium aurantiacum]|uniref:SgcJ/EcaC family oxidoreductase n=1 Tax=Dactylosporangium aurantiacum TaxID=35754 RepID=A0A9Q9IUK4_9ACTN|nr:SgcJ/EcaC family oxidoreductase [Dactylosporangium aurantiacum]MDG6108011.1 SgcJ/EcaC family oxidoreductase [Dactylosporangium aurantiacum]UWZ59248.1 SgcJ/EcaC family oxidoreductase [Dactylosporangium aurantiacum]